MSTALTSLSWDHKRGSLWLCVGERQVAVPTSVAALMLGDAGYGLTDDPAIDVLRLEQDLRRYRRSIGDTAATAREEVGYGCDAATLAYGEITCEESARQRRLALTHLSTALGWYTTCAAQLRHVRSWIKAVRWFVIGAGVPDGLLAEAARGWRRPSIQPSFVIAYETMKAFIEHDHTRADRAWWGYRSDTAGVSFGDVWRRDGDDDDPQAAPLPRCGPWRLAYLPRTGEILAHRRAGHQPEKVWLLASGWDVQQATAVLSGLRSRMREPNSLLLVAWTLHAEPPTATELVPYLNAV